jgi:uncharacterized protein
MIYLDTNVIVYAITKDEKYGRCCAKILRDAHEGKLKACASIFVLIETMNVIRKINKMLKEKNAPLLDVEANVDALLSMPITWLDINFTLIRQAASYEYRIAPADYFHVATMDINRIKTIISADGELDTVDIIKRTDPLKY